MIVVITGITAGQYLKGHTNGSPIKSSDVMEWSSKSRVRYHPLIDECKIWIKENCACKKLAKENV